MNKETQENTGCAPGPGCVCVMSLILSAILISSGIDFLDYSLIIIGSLIPIFWVIFYILYRRKVAHDKQVKLNQEMETARIQKERLEAAVAKCKQKEDLLINEHGKPNKIIRLATTDINRYFVVFGEKELLFVNGVLVNFGNILSYSIIDDYSIAKGTIIAKTSTETNASEAITLGVTGSMIGGEAGAIIGSSLASNESTTTISQNEDKIRHNYILNINVKDINNPLIKFVIGNNTDISMEINAIMLYITECNK